MPERMFFILALGRSGTNFLADLLSRAEDAVVLHEPDPADPKNLPLRYYGVRDEVVDNLIEQRFERVLANQPPCSTYGEVNSYLRYEVPWLRAHYAPSIFHLIRDGRDVVRSIYSRWTYTPFERHVPILPRRQDPASESWAQWTRFQKICWYWDQTNRSLMDEEVPLIRFEDIIADYRAFKEEVTDPIGLHISHEVWSRYRNKPRNTSVDFLRSLGGRRKRKQVDRTPAWPEWPEAWRSTFRSMCGETMERAGYTLDAHGN